MLYGSLHVDPGAGWFPHFFGHADETGAGDGEGATLNLPLRRGHRRRRRGSTAVRDLADVRRGRRDALVVSLGVDAAADDPESPLQVTADGYAAAGRLLGALGLPDGRRPGGRLPPRRPSAASSRAYLDGHATGADRFLPRTRWDMLTPMRLRLPRPASLVGWRWPSASARPRPPIPAARRRTGTGSPTPTSRPRRARRSRSVT